MKPVSASDLDAHVREIVQWHFDPATGLGNGSVFLDADPGGVLWGVRTALAWFADGDVWSQLIRNAMAADFSWPRQVPHYEELYRSLL